MPRISSEALRSFRFPSNPGAKLLLSASRRKNAGISPIHSISERYHECSPCKVTVYARSLMERRGAFYWKRDGVFRCPTRQGESSREVRAPNLPSVSNHVVINVDANAKNLTFVINGDLWDGGARAFGYARFNPFMCDVNGETRGSFSSDFKPFK